LLELFPSAKRDISDGFIGAIASVLAEYPRQIAMKCVHPKNGLAGEAVFISIAGLIGWLERETNGLREHADYELRVERQILDVAEWRAATPSERLKAAGLDWLERRDPLAQKLSGENDRGRLARQARERLIHDYGRDKFNSIPNAKKTVAMP
jgi:hypothetical protein